MPEPETAIDRLRLDLLDGEDLSLALSLITDVLQRRVRRVRYALEEVERGDANSDELRAITSQVQRRMAQFEEQVSSRRDQLQDVIEDFQTALAEFAEALEDDAND